MAPYVGADSVPAPAVRRPLAHGIPHGVILAARLMPGAVLVVAVDHVRCGAQHGGAHRHLGGILGVSGAVLFKRVGALERVTDQAFGARTKCEPVPVSRQHAVDD